MEEIEVIVAPGGTYAVKIVAWEARNTQWVYIPSLIETRTGTVIFAFNDICWSMDQVNWRSESVVHLALRKFPGDHRPATLALVVDCARQTAVIGAGTECGLTEIEQTLEAAFEKKPGGH